MININVFPSMGGVLNETSKNITATIKTITRNGLVLIQFNEEMMTPLNSSLIDNRTLSLSIVDQNGHLKNIEYSWNVTLYSGNSMNIQLKFQNIYIVSKNVNSFSLILLYRHKIIFK